MFYQGKLCCLIVLSSLLISQTTFAKDAMLNDKLLSCSKIHENQERLACFDAFVKKSQVVGNKVGSNNPVLKSETSKQDVDAFAKNHVKKTDEERANEITTIKLTISALSKTVYGKWKITFENGQKWQQKDSVKLSLKKGQRVVLSKGALNAVYLQKENTNKRISVKRLK